MSPTKVCGVCGLPKPIEPDFYTTAKGRVSWACRQCVLAKRKSYVQQYKRTKRPLRKAELRAIVVEFKNKPCADCGRSGLPSYCMDTDHRDPSTKQGDICDLVAAGVHPDRLRAELAKCDVVCAVCHRIRTHEGKLYLARPVGRKLMSRRRRPHVRICRPQKD